MIDGTNTVVAKESGKYALQDFAIGEHVGNAAGHSQIVFEDHEVAIGEARQVGAANADIDIARDAETAHFAAEVTATVNQFARHYSGGQDFAVVIDVFEEEIEGGDALD